jgi:hypothetical protein
MEDEPPPSEKLSQLNLVPGAYSRLSLFLCLSESLPQTFFLRYAPPFGRKAPRAQALPQWNGVLLFVFLGAKTMHPQVLCRKLSETLPAFEAYDFCPLYGVHS